MIFPDWGAAPQNSGGADLPLYTEWAVDWEGGTFALRNGEPYTVTGTEALKIWVQAALHGQSVRYACSAHSADYGNCLAALMAEGMDRGLLENRLRKEIRETLLVSPYITEVDGFAFTRTQTGLRAAFTVHTRYDDFNEEVEMP